MNSIPAEEKLSNPTSKDAEYEMFWSQDMMGEYWEIFSMSNVTKFSSMLLVAGKVCNINQILKYINGMKNKQEHLPVLNTNFS